MCAETARSGQKSLAKAGAKVPPLFPWAEMDIIRNHQWLVPLADTGESPTRRFFLWGQGTRFSDITAMVALSAISL
jgi:hypothetical protein